MSESEKCGEREREREREVQERKSDRRVLKAADLLSNSRSWIFARAQPREAIGSGARTDTNTCARASVLPFPARRPYIFVYIPNGIGTHNLSGPVMRATARLPQRRPHIPRYGVWGCLNMRDWLRCPSP